MVHGVNSVFHIPVQMVDSVNTLYHMPACMVDNVNTLYHIPLYVVHCGHTVFHVPICQIPSEVLMVDITQPKHTWGMTPLICLPFSENTQQQFYHLPIHVCIMLVYFRVHCNSLMACRGGLLWQLSKVKKSAEIVPFTERWILTSNDIKSGLVSSEFLLEVSTVVNSIACWILWCWTLKKDLFMFAVIHMI